MAGKQGAALSQPLMTRRDYGAEADVAKDAGYKGNPDGKDIYPNEVDHGYDEPLAGGHDVMRRLQNQLVHEQGNDDQVRPAAPEIPNLPGKGRQAHAAIDRAAELLGVHVGRFPEGVSADPTENMSPEDAKKWHEMNDEHGDKFKKEAARWTTFVVALNSTKDSDEAVWRRFLKTTPGVNLVDTSPHEKGTDFTVEVEDRVVSWFKGRIKQERELTLMDEDYRTVRLAGFSVTVEEMWVLFTDSKRKPALNGAIVDLIRTLPRKDCADWEDDDGQTHEFEPCILRTGQVHFSRPLTYYEEQQGWRQTCAVELKIVKDSGQQALLICQGLARKHDLRVEVIPGGDPHRAVPVQIGIVKKDRTPPWSDNPIQRLLGPMPRRLGSEDDMKPKVLAAHEALDRVADLMGLKGREKKAAPDYAWWDRNGRSFKMKATAAERLLRTDPKKALQIANSLFEIMEQHGYPDDWSRIERLKDDAQFAIQRQQRWAAEDEKDAKFEKGKPADPTKEMSPEDAAEWEKQQVFNKDQFTGKTANHHEEGGKWYGDTDFINRVQYVYPGAELHHMGFGEFYLTTPDGRLDFDRGRGKDFSGQSGRSHLLTDDKHGKVIEKAIELMERANKSDKVASRPLYEIAREIRQDWRPVNYAAKPYLDAMTSLRSIRDDYGMDSGTSIVAYFLANASTWRGEVAKRVKAELKALLAGKGASVAHEALDKFARMVVSAPSYQDYVEEKKRKHEEPLPKDEWESKVLGKGSDKDEKPAAKPVKVPRDIGGIMAQYQSDGDIFAQVGSHAIGGKEIGSDKVEEAIGKAEQYLETAKAGQGGWGKTEVKELTKVIRGLKGLLPKKAALDVLARLVDADWSGEGRKPDGKYEEGEVEKGNPSVGKGEQPMAVPTDKTARGDFTQAEQDDPKDAKFEEGKPADPTQNMSPEDRAKWEKSNEEHGDKFKTASAGDAQALFEEGLDLLKRMGRHPTTPKPSGSKTTVAFSGRHGIGWWIVEGDTVRLTFPSPRDADAEVVKAVHGLSGAAWDSYQGTGESGRIYRTADLQPGQRIFWACGPSGHVAWQEIGGEKVAVNLPADVERYVEETKEKNPDYDEGQAWAVAWSRYCKYKNPGSEHCQRDPSDYFTGRTAADERIDLFAAVYGDGALWGVTEAPQGRQASFWPTAVRADSDFKVYRLANVPVVVAERLADQGTGAQFYRDGYAAWDVAKKYAVGGLAVEHRASADKEAARPPSGLYGFKKAVQSDCEASIRKLSRIAAKVAKQAWEKDERVADFLTAHAKRADSLPARVLLAAMQEIGPRVATAMRVAAKGPDRDGADWHDLTDEKGHRWTWTDAANKCAPAFHITEKGDKFLLGMLTPDGTAYKYKGPLGSLALAYLTASIEYRMLVQEPGKVWTKTATEARVAEWEKASGSTWEKVAGQYGLYGFPHRASRIGLTACTTVREAAGQIACDLHARRVASHGDITGFLQRHSKEAKCRFARLLHASYPDANAKIASDSKPVAVVSSWLAWEE